MKEETNKLAIRVAGVVQMNDGFVLMHRKNVIRNKDYQEYYTFPGGHLEEGETLEEGVIREIKEEFGIHVKVVRKMCIRDSLNSLSVVIMNIRSNMSTTRT